MLPRSKTSQRKDATDPKLVREKWLLIKTRQRKVVTDQKRVREKLLPIKTLCVQTEHTPLRYLVERMSNWLVRMMRTVRIGMHFLVQKVEDDNVGWRRNWLMGMSGGAQCG